jgi:predicted acyl esterase
LAVALAIAALAATASSASAAQTVEELSFEASDGVRLHATVSGEAPLQPRPLIVEYSPYGQGPGGPPVGPAFNYVQVHARGTGRSDGSWDIMGPREQLDIAESLRFFCDQPWSNGRIALYGFSASAIAAYNAMREHALPCVEVAGLMAGTSSIYRDLIFIGGMPNLAPATVVSTAIASAFLSNLPGRFGDGPQSVGEAPAGGLGGVMNALSAFFQHDTEDDFWQKRIFPGPEGPPPDIPILAVTGFYDVESRGPFETFKAARSSGSHLLVIGAHDGEAGGSGGPFPQFERWFEHYLLGENNGIETDPRVQLYVGHGSHGALRGGAWTKVDASDWPVPGTAWRGLHFDATRSGSATSLNDGSLALERPANAVTQSGPTVPSNTFETDPYTTATVTSVQRSNLTEATSLTYTTPPLSQPVMAVGPAALKLRLASTSPETDIVAVLSDVAPNGDSNPVAAGRLRSTFTEIDRSRSVTDPSSGEIVQPYNDLSEKRDVPPGSARTYHVELWPIGNRFEQGHRIRLTLAGTPASFTPSVPALNSIVVGGPEGATLQMPTLPGSDLCGALGGAPCLTKPPAAGAQTRARLRRGAHRLRGCRHSARPRCRRGGRR